jgi:hypothetical protein
VTADHMSETEVAIAEHESCHRCGGSNITWFAPSPLWNLVMRGNDINGDALHDDLVCVPCFVFLAAEAGVEGVWRVSVDPEPDGLVKVTPSGRVWDEYANRWVEPVTADHAPERLSVKESIDLARLREVAERPRSEAQWAATFDRPTVLALLAHLADLEARLVASDRALVVQQETTRRVDRLRVEAEARLAVSDDY